MLRLRRKASGPLPLLMEVSGESLHHLVYQSAITAPLGEPELVALLTQSRAFNAAHGLTGVLLYNEREFLQLLEGPRAHVHAVFARIARDPRHNTVVKLADGPIAKRQFAQWSMGFRAVQPVDFAHFTGYATAGTEKLAGADPALPDSALHTLLASFEADITPSFDA